MKKSVVLVASAMVLAGLAAPSFAKDKIIGVSWSNFQEERWKPMKPP